MKRINYKIFSVLFFVIFISLTALAQPVPLGPQQNSNNSDTPNLTPPSNVWTQTSPQTQVILGIVDVVILGSVQLLEDPEFKVAGKKYRTQKRVELAAKTKYDTIQKQIAAEEKTLEELKASRVVSERELYTQTSLIATKENELARARNLLTTSEKTSRLAAIKTRNIELSNQAIQAHNGPISSQDDVFNSLPSSEKSEFEKLRNENNEIHGMPDVNREQKLNMIAKSEADLKASREARDLTLQNIQSIQQRMESKSFDIEKLRPSLQSTETLYKAERDLAEAAKTEMTLVAEKKGAKRLGYKVLRISGDLIFGIDLGTRFIYYYVADQDPGFFSFGKILQK